MIVIHKRPLGTSVVEYWKQVPDIKAMCEALEARRRLADYHAERRHGNLAQPFVALHLDTAKPVMVLEGGEAYYAITIGEEERHLLSTGNDSNGKFAIPMNTLISMEQDKALTKLLIHDWIRLIDVAPVKPYPDKPVAVYRVFALSPLAYEWVHDESRNSEPVGE